MTTLLHCLKVTVVTIINVAPIKVKAVVLPVAGKNQLEEDKSWKGIENGEKMPPPKMEKMPIGKYNRRSKKARDAKTHRSDLKYKEIRRLLARKEREKRERTAEIIEEFYVDSSRMISVQMSGTDDDLKKMMQTSGIKGGALMDLDTGEPTSKSYIQLAHYHMKAGRLDPALYYLEVAVSMDSESLNALSALAKCHLRMGHWMDAMKAAEIVMSQDRNNLAAILVKAEALYNTCFFEHSLVLFYRGKTLAPDNESFRLGIQKCQKTIQDTVKDENVFKVPGVKVLFKLLRTASEMHTVGVTDYGKKKKPVSFKGLLSNMDIKKPGLLKQIKAMGKPNDPDFVAAPNVAANEADEDESESERTPVPDKSNFLTQKLAEVEKIMNIAKPEFDAKAEHQKRAEEGKLKTKSGDTKGTARGKAKRKEEQDKNPPKPKAKIKISQLMASKKQEEDDEKAKQKREAQKKAEKLRGEKKNKIYMGADRLLEDKLYLTILAEGGIGFRTDKEDTINEDVAYEAQEALEFLDAREKFWDQIDLGSGGPKKGRPGKPTKALESFRWLM